MEIKDLLIFQSVARNGSISKAADELNYVQSHITARIKSLELNLKTQLFDRHSKGTTVNSEGKRLLVHSEKILFMIEEMEKDFQESSNPSGTLEIGTVETVAKLPMILSNFHMNYPNVELTLKTGVNNDLINDILNHKLDGAFVTGFEEHPDIEQIEVFKEELVLIADNQKVSFSSLKQKPMLVFSKGCSYRARLENWLTDSGMTNAKVMEFGTLETILESVITGLGISLVPKSTVRYLKLAGDVRCYPVPKKYSDISTVFIRQANTYLTKTMQKFIDTIHTLENEIPRPFVNPNVDISAIKEYSV